MTQLGTFWEGFVLIVAAIAVAMLGSMLKIPWLGTIAPMLLAAGLAYVGGGAAGKLQTIRALRAHTLMPDRLVLKLKEKI